MEITFKTNMAAEGVNKKMLKFEIAAYSSFSSHYLPEHILENKPNDQASRWSSDSNQPPQFLLLKLQKPAIVTSILFGKYEKTHVCNVKKLKVFGGMSEENLIELLDGGLKNDSSDEEFPVKHKIDSHYFPCRYIKIVPLLSWGPSFNFSIWYVELRGISDPVTVRQCLNWFDEYREREAIRLCLKHFRQHNFLDAYQALQRQSNISLEHPLLTHLHQLLVMEGDFEASELAIEQAAQENLFGEFLSEQDYKTEWTPLDPFIQSNADVGWAEGEYRPGMRGGHQMCIDSHTDTVYMFGGWDGSKDLADFWSFESCRHKWTCISKNASDQGGPSPRSCHKMSIDEVHRQIFCLGRYLDNALRTPENVKGDFHMYDIETARWTLLTDDTQAMGGPGLIFDHQMTVDTHTRTIYIFGGRILTSSPGSGLVSGSGESADILVGSVGAGGGGAIEAAAANDNSDSSAAAVSSSQQLQFSGLYSYHIPTGTWKLLRDDCEELKSRVSHSMLFHAAQRCLYIFAGQRGREYLNDFVIYNVDTDTVRYINDGTCQSMRTVPSVGFTQRATIDSELQEIHVLTGLSKDRDKTDAVQNSLWIYDITRSQWSCVYSKETNCSGSSSCSVSSSGGSRAANQVICDIIGGQQQPSSGLLEHHPREPVPRYAHQFVYNHVRKVHYLFGGNPGSANQLKMRLDDFWLLKLCRPSREDVLRRCRYLLRRQCYEELSSINPVRALRYLQTRLHDVVDHTKSHENNEFQMLPSLLFKSTTPGDEDIHTQFDLFSSFDSASSLSVTYRPHLSHSSSSSSGRGVDEGDEMVQEGGRGKFHVGRSQLFDRLMIFFPVEMTQPRDDIVNLINIH